jgi:hypothetical protein
MMSCAVDAHFKAPRIRFPDVWELQWTHQDLAIGRKTEQQPMTYDNGRLGIQVSMPSQSVATVRLES